MTKGKQKKVFTIAIGFICGVIIGGYIGKERGIPFFRKELEWSIGIYTGKSAFDLASPPGIRNPVLKGEDVTDVPAQSVADPFMVYEKDTWYMFFEVMNISTKQGDIGLATSSDGFDWTYKQIVIDEPFHLSYPYVFKWEDEFYMIPACSEEYCVRLYKAVDFPTKWSFVKNLLSGQHVDSSIFFYNERWWLFSSMRGNSVLRLFYAKDLNDTWTEHPESPVIVHNKDIARPGGRVLLLGNRIFRYTQDCDPDYGNQVRAFEITELTTEIYKEREVPDNPILKPSGRGWNAGGMHNIDPHLTKDNEWISCVDGRGKFWVFGFQY